MSWIQTANGERVHPLDPVPTTLQASDVAHALGNLCRFGGHTRVFYSVAQHSVLVARLCSPHNKFWALLHDATEAFLVDIPRPIKKDPRFAFYREAEAVLMAAVCARFGLPPAEPDEVRWADGVMLMAEQRDLMSPMVHPWDDVSLRPDADRLVPRIEPWPPHMATAVWMESYVGLALEGR